MAESLCVCPRVCVPRGTRRLLRNVQLTLGALAGIDVDLVPGASVAVVLLHARRPNASGTLSLYPGLAYHHRCICLRHVLLHTINGPRMGIMIGNACSLNQTATGTDPHTQYMQQIQTVRAQLVLARTSRTVAFRKARRLASAARA